MEIGDASFFAPYLKIIDHDPFLPFKYSKAGQLLLGKVFGLYMRWNIGSFLEWFEKNCGLDIENDPVGVQATLISLTRSCSHIDFDALKDIPAGEQIYANYGTGTIKHLLQYVFLDLPPQIWMFDTPKTEGQSGHTLEPTAEDIKFLSTSELERLELLHDEILKDAESLPSEEKSVIIQFYYALLFAIKSASVSTHAKFDLNEEAKFDEEVEFEVDDEFDNEADFEDEFDDDDEFEMNEEL
eukprot:scaffold148470_cov58-Attheya_sp.AAC.2